MGEERGKLIRLNSYYDSVPSETEKVLPAAQDSLPVIHTPTPLLPENSQAQPVLSAHQFADGSWMAAGKQPDHFAAVMNVVSGGTAIEAGPAIKGKARSSQPESVIKEVRSHFHNPVLKKVLMRAFGAYMIMDVVFVGAHTAHEGIDAFAENTVGRVPFIGQKIVGDPKPDAYALNSHIGHDLWILASGGVEVVTELGKLAGGGGK